MTVFTSSRCSPSPVSKTICPVPSIVVYNGRGICTPARVLCSFCQRLPCPVVTESSTPSTPCFIVVQQQTTSVVVFFPNCPGPDIIFDRVICIVFSCISVDNGGHFTSPLRFTSLTTADSGIRQLPHKPICGGRVLRVTFLFFITIRVGYLIIEIRYTLGCGIFYSFSYRHNCTENVYNYLRGQSSSP